MENNYSVALSGSAIEVLKGLFIHGPLWDGDVPSKTGRDELVQFGLAARLDGFQQLTKEGLRLALANGLHKEKDRRHGEHNRGMRVYHAVMGALEPDAELKKTNAPTVKDALTKGQDLGSNY